MNITHQDVVLDVNYNKSNVIVNAHQGDTGTRFIDVTLTQSGEVITMSDTFTATAKASIYGTVKAVNECEVDTVNNKIIVELTNTMLDTPGKLICEITLSEGEQIITTQMFTVNIAQSVLNGSTEIVRNTELEKLLKVISLVPELSQLENLEDLREKATTAYNRVVQYTKTAVDLNSTSITDTNVVNLSGCTVDNAPVTGAISGTVVNFNYKVDLDSIIVQFLIMRNNYTYKRSYGSSGWSSWVLVADDMSQYLKTADLPGEILSDTPSNTNTYHSNKINELLSDKEDNSNKLTTGSSSVEEVQYPSLAYLHKYNYTKLEADTLLSGKAEKSAVDNNTFDLSMLMSSLKRTATGTSLVNLTNTAENGILKVTATGGVTVKNKNMFENILIDGASVYNCNVSYDNTTGKYTVEYTGAENGSFSFGNVRTSGLKYVIGCGQKQKYNRNLSIRVNCDEVTRNAFYITYFDSNGVSLGVSEMKKSNTIYKIDDVEGAEFFTIQISFNYNPGLFTTGDIFHFSVQIEYGDTVSDFVVPMSNTNNLSYEGVTNIVGDGEITVEYIPVERKVISVDLPIYNGGVVE